MVFQPALILNSTAELRLSKIKLVVICIKNRMRWVTYSKSSLERYGKARKLSARWKLENEPVLASSSEMRPFLVMI